MPGPAPRDPALRRRRNAPAGGEWVDISSPAAPVLPPLPRRKKAEGPWPSRTREVWSAWRGDPATTMYGPADVRFALDTAYVHASWIASPGRVSLAAEVRARMDALGLTAKGRRNLRWRVVDNAPSEPESVESEKEHIARLQELAATAWRPRS